MGDLAANFDLVVIGGGLAGMGVAYESLRRGKRVCVVEHSPPFETSSKNRRYESAMSTGASFKNAGMMNLLKPFKTITNSWQVTTLNVFRALGVPVEHCGLNLLVDNVVEATGVNLAYPHRLRGDTLKKYIATTEPNIMPHITVFREAEHGDVANPEVAVPLLRAALVHLGLAVVSSEVARAQKDGEVWDVGLVDGTHLRAARLVVAAGPRSKEVAQALFGIDLPTVPVLGVITEFTHDEALDPWFRGLVMGGHSAFSWGMHTVLEQAHLRRNSLEITRDQLSSKQTTTHLYVSRGGPRSIYVGGPRIVLHTLNDGDLAPERYQADMDRSIAYAHTLLRFPPSLRRVGAWSGIMSFPADTDYPLVGPLREADGLWLCTAFASAGFREGFGAGMWMGKLMWGGEHEALDKADKDMMADWRKVMPHGRVKDVKRAAARL